MTNYLITDLTDNSVSIKMIEQTEINGTLYNADPVRKAFTNDRNSIEELKILVPEPWLTTILTRWQSDQVVVVQSSEVSDIMLTALPIESLAYYNPNNHQYRAGDLFRDDFLKYKVEVDFISSADFIPNTVGARDTVHPFNSSEPSRWAHGEVLPYPQLEREYEQIWYYNTRSATSEENRTAPNIATKNTEPLWQKKSTL